MNRWLTPILLIGLVSTIALSVLSPLFPLSYATAQPVEMPSRAPKRPLPTAIQPIVAIAKPITTPTRPASKQPTGGAIPPATATNAPAIAQPGVEIAPSTIALTIADLINRQRAQAGLAPLALAPALAQAATRHSLDMGKQPLPSHQGTDGSSGGERMVAAGYPWQGWAEVIGWGFIEPASMVDWWLNHAEHRAILLSPTFTDFGVGYVTLANTPWKNYWTVNFGRPQENHLPLEAGLPTTPAPAAGQALNNGASSGSIDGCPVTSTESYPLIPMTGVDVSHPAPSHADLNLAQRGYTAIAIPPAFTDLNGPVDEDAPQLAQLFGNHHPIHFAALYQVYYWEWRCGEHGCRHTPLTAPEVTLLGLQSEAGTPLYSPARQASIYRDSHGDDYVAVALYAEANRLTLAYTRDGSVAQGYVVHLEQICVDPLLVQRYTAADRDGRWQLPALRHDQSLGVARTTEVRLAIRDRGTFLDPRSRKDWWRGF